MWVFTYKCKIEIDFLNLVENIYERYSQEIYRVDFDSFNGDFQAAKQAVQVIDVEFSNKVNQLEDF